MADKHGGARPGTGRKALGADVKFLMNVTAAQREKIDANGGAPWVRGLIDADPGSNPLTADHVRSQKEPSPRLNSIKPDPKGLKGREIEGIKSAKAVAKRLKAITPKKP